MEWLNLVLQGFGISFFWMAILWLIGKITKNYAIVDFGWGLSLLFYCVFYALKTDGLSSKEILALVAVSIWSLRLSHYLFYERILGHEEEGRYKKLREYFSVHIDLKFFFFFQAQALFNVILSLPFLVIAMDSQGVVGLLDLFAFSISLFSIFGESLADEQLKEFKSNPNNKGKVCDVGLWAYSRHPNYFFEFCIWVGYFLMGLLHEGGIWGIVAPLSILYTLLKFTGIPATEEQAVRSKGDLYRNYQKRVSVFVPWFPKKGLT